MANEAFKTIQIDMIAESETNPRRAADAAGLKELAASIKEKGVLVPVIVRDKDLGELGGVNFRSYELVAGSRRLAAAKMAGLKEIPASIRELTDAEAREVQIIENLQREDVHPIDEAHAYKTFVETVKDIKAIASKVGKSEAYVRNRLVLVQLAKEPEAAYRKGEINDGHAIELAALSPAGDQQAVLKWMREETRYGGTVTVKELQDHIAHEFTSDLENQPWVGNTAAEEAVGPCKECPPNRSTLFGEVKAGACTSLNCWARKMKKFVAWKKEQTEGAVLISESYCNVAGVLSNSQYRDAGKKKCEHIVTGVIAAEQRGAGRTKKICLKRGCKVHDEYNSSRAPMTPEERAAAKKAKEAEKRKEEAAAKKETERVNKALAKISWPPTGNVLDVLYAFVDEETYGHEEIAAAHGLNVEEKNEHSYTRSSEALADLFKQSDDAGKLRLIVEMVIRKEDHLAKKL